MTEQEIIDKIFEIRIGNNIPWKRLMEIAFKYAPDETRSALTEILHNDREVTDWLDILLRVPR